MRRDKWIWVAIVISGILAAYSVATHSDTEPLTKKVGCRECHFENRKAKLAEYFNRNGSKTPEEMANAVLKTKSPRLLAAIAVVESDGNPATRNTGYKKRHHGAFQVNPRYHGAVPRDAVGQALQAERILKDLTDDMPIKKALSVYGGDSTDNYSKIILAELARVP